VAVVAVVTPMQVNVPELLVVQVAVQILMVSLQVQERQAKEIMAD